jgi:hypothetical protein
MANSAGFSRIGMGIFYTKTRGGGNDELNKSATDYPCAGIAAVAFTSRVLTLMKY